MKKLLFLLPFFFSTNLFAAEFAFYDCVFNKHFEQTLDSIVYKRDLLYADRVGKKLNIETINNYEAHVEVVMNEGVKMMSSKICRTDTGNCGRTKYANLGEGFFSQVSKTTDSGRLIFYTIGCDSFTL